MGWPLISAVLFLSALTAFCVLKLWHNRAMPQNDIGGFYPAVEIRKEGTWFVFNLALFNNSVNHVWAEECFVSLSDFDGKASQGFEATRKGLLPIRMFAKAGEILRIGLCQTVYDARMTADGTSLISTTSMSWTR